MPLHEVSCCTKHKFANEGESGEHAESQNSSSKGFTVTNPEKRYAPHLHIEPKHLDISIDATHLEQKLVDIKLTYLLENNTVGASNITFNCLGTNIRNIFLLVSAVKYDPSVLIKYH
jgi:hypothetical protein